MSTPTLADLLPYLGRQATWQTSDGIQCRGFIRDGRRSYGHDHFLIELPDGQRIWKRCESVNLEEKQNG